MDLSGLIERVSRRGGGGPKQLSLNELGILRTDRYLPDYAQLAKARKIWGFTSGTGTAIAPVTAIPTTAAAWSVFNGNEPGEASLAVLLAACWSVSGTLGLGMTLLGSVSLAAVAGTKPTAYASSVVSSLSGSRATPRHLLAQGLTLVGTPAWVPLASRDQVSAISVGSGLVADVRGMLLIPPQFTGNFTVLAPTGSTALFGIAAVAADVELDLE